jgi:uncharacterized membrane protein YdjX (TVP38/TMEM64 family)
MTRGLLAHGRLWGSLALVLALLLLAHATGLRDHFSAAYLREVFLAHKLWGIVVFAALFSLGNLIHVPGLLFLLAAVLALGKLWGGLATYVAANVSCLVTFVVLRWIGRDSLLLIQTRWVRRVLATLHARPVRGVVLLRTFLQTLPTLNMALAMSGIRLRHYVLGTLIGLPLPIAFYCMFFDLLAQGVKSL